MYIFYIACKFLLIYICFDRDDLRASRLHPIYKFMVKGIVLFSFLWKRNNSCDGMSCFIVDLLFPNNWVVGGHATFIKGLEFNAFRVEIGFINRLVLACIFHFFKQFKFINGFELVFIEQLFVFGNLFEFLGK